MKVIGEEIISEFPEFPGLQQYLHFKVCVLVCIFLPWADRALSGSRNCIDLRIGITQSQQPVG